MPLGTCESIRFRCRTWARCNRTAVAWLLVCLSAVPSLKAQTTPATSRPASGTSAPTQSATPQGVQDPAAKPSTPPASRFPSDAATQPAKVLVRDGKLSIEANNSDLPQILNQVARASGIAIKGINGGPRMFGTYGPGEMRDVLSTLLSGSGYNFIMVGGSGNGPPREVLLTPVAKSTAKAVQPVGNPDDDEPEADIQDFDPTDTNESQPPPSTPDTPVPPSITQMPEGAPVPEGSPVKEDPDVQKTLERLKTIQDTQAEPPQ